MLVKRKKKVTSVSGGLKSQIHFEKSGHGFRSESWSTSETRSFSSQPKEVTENSQSPEITSTQSSNNGNGNNSNNSNGNNSRDSNGNKPKNGNGNNSNSGNGNNSNNSNGNNSRNGNGNKPRNGNGNKPRNGNRNNSNNGNRNKPKNGNGKKSVIESKPKEIPGPGPIDSAKKWAKKNKGKLILAAGAAGVGLIGYSLAKEANKRDQDKEERDDLYRRINLYNKSKNFSGYDDYPWEYESREDIMDDKEYLIRKLGRVGFLTLLAENMNK